MRNLSGMSLRRLSRDQLRRWILRVSGLGVIAVSLMLAHPARALSDCYSDSVSVFSSEYGWMETVTVVCDAPVYEPYYGDPPPEEGPGEIPGDD